jgi:hypothetical protein
VTLGVDSSHKSTSTPNPGVGDEQGWQIVGPERLRDDPTATAIQSLMRECTDRLLLHDPIWIAGPRDGPGAPEAAFRGVACLMRREGELIGYAPLTQGMRALRIALGEWTFYRRLLPSFTLVHDICWIGTSNDERLRFVCDLFRKLHESAGRRALFLEGIPTDSALLSIVTRFRAGGWIPIPIGKGYEHHFADLPESFSEYERALGSKSQKSLRYSQRKLSEHVCGAVRARRFATREDVPEFMAGAQAISQKTYQWKLLGLGLRDAQSLSAWLNLAADHGWMRCYILYCKEEPVAFMLGYLYRGVYHYIDIGYDPDWGKWSVGSILQMEVMRDLLAGEDSPDLFDFSTGTGAHKARFGNVSRQEVDILLLRRSPGNMWLACLYVVTVVVDRWATAIADWLGVKVRLKKWLRRTA